MTGLVDVWMDTANAALYAGCSQEDVRRACRSKVLRHGCTGRDYVIRLEWIDQWLEDAAA